MIRRPTETPPKRSSGHVTETSRRDRGRIVPTTAVPVQSGARDAHPCSTWGGLSGEESSKLHFGLIQDAPAFGRQCPAAPIDLEIEHRHGRLEGSGLASPARLRGSLQRERDLPGTLFL